MQPAPSDPAVERRTEIPDPGPGAATPPPIVFTVVLWMGAFFAIAWGFRVLFIRLSQGRPLPEEEGRSPHAEDVTLEERGPDRS